MCKKAGIRDTGTNLPPAPHTEKAPQQAEKRKSGAVRALITEKHKKRQYPPEYCPVGILFYSILKTVIPSSVEPDTAR